MRLEVLLAEGPRRRPALDLPLRPVRDEDAAPVQLLKGIPREGAPDIVLAVVALDVLEVGRMVDDVEAEEGVDLLDLFLQQTTDVYTVGGMVFAFLAAGRKLT